MSRCSPYVLHIRQVRPCVNASTDSPISSNDQMSRRSLRHYRPLLPHLPDQPPIL
jgi:hypothetical protein